MSQDDNVNVKTRLTLLVLAHGFGVFSPASSRSSMSSQSRSPDGDTQRLSPRPRQMGKPTD